MTIKLNQHLLIMFEPELNIIVFVKLFLQNLDNHVYAFQN